MISIVAAVGCGSDDSAGSPGVAAANSGSPDVNIPWGPESLNRAEYTRRANGVCKESWEQMLESFAQRYQSETTAKKFTEASKNIFLPGMQFWFDDISYLGAPPGEKEQVETILTAIQLAVFSGQKQTALSPKQLATIFSESNRLVHGHGLDSCRVSETSFMG